MTLGPRIVFVSFGTSHSLRLVPWVAHVSRVVGSGVPEAPPDIDYSIGRVVWQLTSANNRELARGTRLYESLASAHEHASQVVTQSERLGLHLVSGAGRGAYGWFASLDGVPVATCARWYPTDRDRRHSLELARRSVRLATLQPRARVADAVAADVRGRD